MGKDERATWTLLFHSSNHIIKKKKNHGGNQEFEKNKHSNSIQLDVSSFPKITTTIDFT